ncbi:MAG TPA: flippase [Verrucomicrobiae bacterium]|nr:flippase [Verrucomicrobiae bacterium]
MRAHTSATRLVQNTASNFAGQLIITVLAFFSTPYITHKLGASQYGALSLLMVYLFAFSLLNLGMNASLVKYLAELLPKKQTEEMQQYLSTSLTVLVGIGAGIAVLVFILAGMIVRHCFNGSANLAPSTVLALRIASVAFILQFLIQVASSIPAAAQRFEIINLVRAGSEALRIIVTVVLLALGFGLPSLMAVVIFASLCACMAYALTSRRVIPGLQLHPGFSHRHLRSLLRHSRYVLVVNLSNQLVGTMDNFLIGAFLPIANVAYYAIAYTLAQRLWTFVGNLISVVFPAASAFAGAEKQDQVKELYLRGMKVAAAAGCFPALALSIFSRPFLLYWLGPDYAKQGAVVLSLLALGFLVNSFTYVPYQVLQSTHYANTAAKGSIVYGAMNLTLFFLLIPRFGIIGAAVAFLLGQILFVPWFVGKSNRLLCVRWQTLFAASYARVFIAAALACSACWFFRTWVDSLFTLAAVVTAGLLLYILLAAALVLDSKERETCRVLAQRWIALLPARA